MAVARAHIYVTGYVQGVFYRHTTAQRARARGLAGWVRNLPDGRVEALFEGEESDVRDLVEWCRSGPAHATVESIDVEWQPVLSDLSGFLIL